MRGRQIYRTSAQGFQGMQGQLHSDSLAEAEAKGRELRTETE